MKPKFFLYARKSTDDLARQVRSIDDQLAELREMARKEGLDIVEEFTERQTAKKPGRPIFNAMLERMKKGEAEGILAWHPDRLSRNSVDAGTIIWLIDTKDIKSLRFPTYYFEPTAHGKFMLGLMLTQSKYYIDKLSEDITRGQRQKLKNGIWPAMAPIGYLNDRAAKIIVPDPIRGPLVRKTFELYATGTYTLDRLTETVNELGLTNATMKRCKDAPLSRSQYHRLLQNPIYCGVIRYRAELHDGKHAPLIDRKLFDDVQVMIKRKTKSHTPILKPYLYRAFFRCGECGCFITIETQKGHNYLRCTKRVKKDCSQGYVREEVIAGQIRNKISEVALPLESTDWLIAEFAAEQEKEDTRYATQLAEAKANVEEATAKISRLTDAYLDKALSLDEFRETKSKLIDAKQHLTEHCRKLEQGRGKRFEPAIRFLNDVKKAEILKSGDDFSSQRDLFKKTGSNPVIKGRETRNEFRGAWKIVAEQGSFAQHDTAPAIAGAVSIGETLLVCTLAERGGFEPP